MSNPPAPFFERLWYLSIMDEKKIKELFEMLIKEIIIPKFPYLSLHSFQGPSESVNTRTTTFYIVFVADKELTKDEVCQIKFDVNNLFTSAGFGTYRFRGLYFGIRADVADAATGYIYDYCHRY